MIRWAKLGWKAEVEWAEAVWTLMTFSASCSVVEEDSSAVVEEVSCLLLGRRLHKEGIRL